MWFYAIGGVRSGPVPLDEIERLLAAKTIGSETLVWREGMAVWTPVFRTELATLPGAEAAPLPFVEGRTSPAAAERWRTTLPTYGPRSLDVLQTWWFVCFGLCVIGCVAMVVLMLTSLHTLDRMGDDGSPDVLPAFLPLILIIPAFAGSIVCYCKFTYRCWEQVDDGMARTQPNIAVGFSFIPLFNIYWQFVAVRGLAIEMCRVIALNGIPVQRPNIELATAFCVLSAGCVVPCVNYLAIPAALVTGIICYIQLKAGAKAILTWRIERAGG